MARLSRLEFDLERRIVLSRLGHRFVATRFDAGESPSEFHNDDAWVTVRINSVVAVSDRGS